MNEKLKKQLDFIVEIDKMKNIFRKSYIADGTKRENDAEHSWHLAMIAIVLSEYIEEDVDLNKVIKLTLVHDLIEIYAGDTFAFDEEGNKDKLQREKNSALKLFGELPKDQGDYIKGLWEEFEAKKTKESRYANMIDTLQPLILEYANKGKGAKESNLTEAQLRKRNELSLKEGPKEFKELIEYIIKGIY